MATALNVKSVLVFLEFVERGDPIRGNCRVGFNEIVVAECEE